MYAPAIGVCACVLHTSTPLLPLTFLGGPRDGDTLAHSLSSPHAPPPVIPWLIAWHGEMLHSSTTRFGLGGLLYYG